MRNVPTALARGHAQSEREHMRDDGQRIAHSRIHTREHSRTHIREHMRECMHEHMRTYTITGEGFSWAQHNSSATSPTCARIMPILRKHLLRDPDASVGPTLSLLARPSHENGGG